ncbi:MAG: hypothetical protein KDD35_03660 [Bdellovibrionales bacterium]|nr:hypothetical protein [Bdellovibrionales bacterium]
MRWSNTGFNEPILARGFSIGSEACPRCGSPTEELLKIEPGMRLSLASVSSDEDIPEAACRQCFEELTRSVSKGVKLRMEAQAREQNKAMLWKSRVNLVKQARQLMSQKAYSEAAVCYEKYLRILEMVFNKKSGELTPEVFNNSKRSKEVTVITSVYWDLFRIYDMSPRYGDRQKKTADKLSIFVKYSTIYPDILKRAESFSRSAKHPEIVRQFLRSAGGVRGRCFIATVVFENPTSKEVLLLRHYRDRVLRKSVHGRRIILIYYRYSPRLAGYIAKSPTLKKCLRPLLRFCAERLGKTS